LDINLLAANTPLTSFEDGLTLQIPYDATKYGTKNLCIMYLDNAGQVEILPAHVVGNGLLEFTVYHLSEYVLAQGTTANTETNPNTGDINLIIIVATTLFVIVIGIILVRQILKHKSIKE